MRLENATIGFAKLTDGKFKTTINIITILAGCWSLTGFFFKIYLSQGIVLYWVTLYLIQYLLIYFVLLSGKYSISEFLADLISTYKTPLDNKDDRYRLLWLYLFSVFVLYAAYFVLDLFYTETSIITIILIIFMHLPAFSIDAIPALNYLLFYHVYAEIKELKRDLKRQAINLEQLQSSYRAIADKFERFRKHYDAIFVFGFVTESLKWIIIILNYLTQMKESTSWFQVIVDHAWAFYITVQICFPAVFAEMISVQTDAMKMILQGQLLVETDERQALKTSRVLEYMEARPLLRKAWRLVPVDLQLPVTILSIGASYLVVAVQFMHLYD